ncbi:hypothetical protein M758_6G055300 [Ceratodon purpureus]|nr:hypothetical protein M758_6G055300 [Ceratodon purpureus]
MSLGYGSPHFSAVPALRSAWACPHLLRHGPITAPCQRSRSAVLDFHLLRPSPPAPWPRGLPPRPRWHPPRLFPVSHFFPMCCVFQIFPCLYSPAHPECALDDGLQGGGEGVSE